VRLFILIYNVSCSLWHWRVWSRFSFWRNKLNMAGRSERIFIPYFTLSSYSRANDIREHLSYI